MARSPPQSRVFYTDDLQTANNNAFLLRALSNSVAMHSYSEKLKIARQQVALGQFPTVQDVEGRTWRGCRYHVMYTKQFDGYFLYKICGLVGKLEEYSKHTWWDFEIQLAMDEEHSDDFEQPLPATEVKAWLALNYGQLAADDYEYLSNILWLEQTSDRCDVLYLRNHRNWQLALAWLTGQHTGAVSLGTVATAVTKSASVHINPWAPLLISALKLNEFYKYLEDCGLLTSDGKLTLLGQGEGLGKARKAPWVGTMLALIKAKLLDGNKAAIGRALLAPAGKVQVKLSENSLLIPSEKSKTYKQVAEAKLRELGYLRN